MLLVGFDIQVKDKEKEKIENYQDLKRELKRIWKLGKTEIGLCRFNYPRFETEARGKSNSVLPIIIGASGTVSNDIEKWSTEIGVTCRLESFESPWKVTPNRGRSLHWAIPQMCAYSSPLFFLLINHRYACVICSLEFLLFLRLEIRNKLI